MTGGRDDRSINLRARLASRPVSSRCFSSALRPILSAPLTSKWREISRLPTIEGEDWMKEKAAVAQDYVKSHAEDLGDRFRAVAEVIGRN